MLLASLRQAAVEWVRTQALRVSAAARATGQLPLEVPRAGRAPQPPRVRVRELVRLLRDSAPERVLPEQVLPERNLGPPEARTSSAAIDPVPNTPRVNSRAYSPESGRCAAVARSSTAGCPS